MILLERNLVRSLLKDQPLSKRKSSNARTIRNKKGIKLA